MNRLWQFGCAVSKDDQRILARIKELVGELEGHPCSDVLQAFRDLDFLLKRSFLMMNRQMTPTEAYAVLHEIWISETHCLHALYSESHSKLTRNEIVNLKDLVELSFFYAENLLNRPDAITSSSPTISVVVPVYRSQRYLWEALRSIYEQTYQDFEVILVNEYLNDDPLEEILSVFGDKRTVIVQKTMKARLGASLNLGIRHAKGRFIARMDSDDIAYPDRLSKQIEFFRNHTDIDFCGTQCRAFGTRNNWNPRPHPLSHQNIQCRSLKYCSFLHPTVMWRKDRLIENNLWYNEEILAEDTDLFARVVFSLKTANLSDTLLLYRREDHNLSSENLKEKDSNSQSLAVMQSMTLEKSNLAALYRTLTENERGLIQRNDKDSFTYGDALRVFRFRLGRDDLSDLLPPDTSNSESVFSANLNNRIPVIWGYGWNGQVLEYTLQQQGYFEYRIVDQRMQELGIDIHSTHSMRMEDLDGMSASYYILVSMDKHYPEVAEKLGRYGYTPQQDYIEYFA